MQAGYIWALRDASVDVEANVAHVSLLTKVNVCAAAGGEERVSEGRECRTMSECQVTRRKRRSSHIKSEWRQTD